LGQSSHSQSAKKASSGGTCLAQWAQYLWGRKAPRGRHAHHVVLGPPSCARPVDAAAGHVPRLLTVSAQHVPPQSPLALSGRHTTPRPQPALRARSRVGRRGAKGPNPHGREGGLKNSIERQGFETWPSFEIWDATFLVRQKRTFCTQPRVILSRLRLGAS
jgi:hypothetical protein